LSNERIVLDAWALLAWLQGEEAGTDVREIVARAEQQEANGQPSETASGETSGESLRLYLNEINLGETYYILGRRTNSKTATSIVSRIRSGPFEIISPDWDLVKKASNWKIDHSISLADAFAVATAHERNAKLATGDPELKDLLDVELIWLPE